MQICYNRNDTIKAKETLTKYEVITKIWKDNYSPSNKIGNCTDLFRKLKPINEEDFCQKYFQYAEDNKNLPISKRGLTNNELIEMATDYMNKSNIHQNINFPFETYLNDALCHIITQTYDGKIRELEFARFLESLGYTCGWFDGRIDAKYGVDIKITDKNAKIYAIQVKPISFFLSANKDTHEDRINLVHKYYDFLNDYGSKTYYAIYSAKKGDKNALWIKNKNGFRFKLDELFEYDINDIENTIKCKQILRDFHKI